MSKKSEYAQTFEAIIEKVSATAKEGRKPSVMTSKSDLTMLATALINSPEHVITTYDRAVKEADGTPLTLDVRPGQRYRDALKPVLRSMGIDKADISKIDEIPFTKEHGAAILDVATHAIKDYATAGRRFSFPITHPDESQMSLTVVTVPERTTQPNKFQTNEDGTTVIVPTGETMTTKEHKALKAVNRNPAWLKTYKKGKK